MRERGVEAVTIQEITEVADVVTAESTPTTDASVEGSGTTTTTEQIWAFAGNAVSQTWTFGMDDFSWARLKWLPDGNVDTAMPDPDRSRAGLDAIGLAHLAALIAAAESLGDAETAALWRERQAAAEAALAKLGG